MPRPATKFAAETSSIATDALGAMWMLRRRPPAQLVPLLSSLTCDSTTSTNSCRSVPCLQVWCVANRFVSVKLAKRREQDVRACSLTHLLSLLQPHDVTATRMIWFHFSCFPTVSGASVVAIKENFLPMELNRSVQKN